MKRGNIVVVSGIIFILGLIIYACSTAPTGNRSNDSNSTSSSGGGSGSLAGISGSVNLPNGAPDGDNNSATVYVIGQESSGTTTDPNGNYNLKVDLNSSLKLGLKSMSTKVTVTAVSNLQLVVITRSKTFGIKHDGIIVNNGQTTSLGPLTVKKMGLISGKITLQNAPSNDNSFILVGIPGTSFMANTAADGTYTISGIPEGNYDYLRAEKDAYNYGMLSGITVTADTTMQVQSMYLLLSSGASGSVVINGGDTYTPYLKVHVALAASSNAVLMKVDDNVNFTNASAISWSALQSSFDYTFNAPGSRTLYVEFNDINGLSSSPVQASITIDTNPLVILNTPTGTINDTKPVFDWTATPLKNSTYKFQLSGYSSFASTIVSTNYLTTNSFALTSFALSNNTTNYYRVAIVGPDGTNWNYTSPQSFIIDLSAVSLTNPVNNAVISKVQPSFSWTATSLAGATYEFVLAGDSNFISIIMDTTNSTPSANLTHTSVANNSTNYWRVRVFDAFGIPGSWAGPDKFIVDTAGPSVTVTSPVNGSTNNSTSITYNILTNDNQSSMASAYYKINGGSYTAITGLSFIASLTNGWNTISVYGVDSLGNIGLTNAYTNFVDSIAPALTLNISDGAFTNVNSFVIGGTTNDALPSSGIKTFWIKTNGTLISNSYWNGTVFSFGADGAYTISVYIEDNAGNSSNISKTITVDTTPPSLSFQPSLSNTFQSGLGSGLAVTVTGSDGSGSGIRRCWLATNTGPFITFNYPSTNIKLHEGSYLLRVKIEDNVGNVSAEISNDNVTIISNTVYVSTTGSDANSGIKSAPLKTIQIALDRAAMVNASNVYVGAGPYTPDNGLLDQSNEAGIILSNSYNGINLTGGWDSSFTAHTGYSELNGQWILIHILLFGSSPTNNNVGAISNITLSGLIIENGYANQSSGGGIYSHGGGDPVSYIVITNCIISNNYAYYNGGGICLNNFYSNTINAVIINNTIDPGSSYGSAGGGGINLNNSSSNHISGTIASNYSPSLGGGLYTCGDVNDLISCDIYSNYSINGAGIYIVGTSNFITGNIYKNTAGNSGGGIVLANGAGGFDTVSATVYNNTAGNKSGGVSFYQTVISPRIINSIITNNTTTSGMNAAIYFSDVETANLVISNNLIGGPNNGSSVYGIYEDGLVSNHILINNIFITNKLGYLYHDSLSNDAAVTEINTKVNIASYSGAKTASGNIDTNL